MHVKKYHDEDVYSKISYKNVMNIYGRRYLKKYLFGI